MKILLINNLYPPYIVGGNEMLASDVVAELRRRGHDIDIATGHGCRLPPEDYVHQVLDLDLDRTNDIFLGGRRPTALELFARHLFNWRSYWALRGLIRRLKPDLIIAWNLYMASMSPLVACRHSRIPTVIQVADKWLFFGLKDVLALVYPSARWQQRLLRLARTVVQPALFKLAKPQHIVTISNFIRDFYASHGFAPEWLTAIQLGVPTEFFTYLQRPAPDTAPLRLLYVGALWEGKGPQVAVRALGWLARKGYNDLRLDIYGAGTNHFESWLRSIVVEEGLEDRVALNGFVSKDRLLEAYHEHDVLVFPSIWDEPFAAVPVEAMSCGMVVVASTAGGTPEAIVDGETGILVPPNDPECLAMALERVLLDGNLRKRIGERAARVARERYDFSAYVDRLEAFYRTLGSP